MRIQQQSTTDEAWRSLVSSIIKTNLKLSRMNYVDLSSALREIGVDEPPKNISSKLVRGTFSAVFLIQTLSAIGVERLVLPARVDPNRKGSR